MLDVLAKVLRHDIAVYPQTGLKLQRPRDFLRHTLIRVERMFKETETAIRKQDGTIIEIRQESNHRRVVYKFKGYQYKSEYLNTQIHVRCEEILWYILTKGNDRKFNLPGNESP